MVLKLVLSLLLRLPPPPLMHTMVGVSVAVIAIRLFLPVSNSLSNPKNVGDAQACRNGHFFPV